MQTNLRIMRISPISALRVSALLAVVLFVVSFLTLSGVYLAVDAFGVIERVQDLFASITAAGDANPLAFLSPSWVLPRLAVVLGGLHLLMIPASVLGALVLNLVLRISNGLELTLRQSV